MAPPVAGARRKTPTREKHKSGRTRQLVSEHGQETSGKPSPDLAVPPSPAPGGETYKPDFRALDGVTHQSAYFPATEHTPVAHFPAKPCCWSCAPDNTNDAREELRYPQVWKHLWITPLLPTTSRKEVSWSK